MEESVWKNRLEKNPWADEESKKLFLNFAKDAALKQIGNRRIDKYRTTFSMLHTITGKTLIQMVRDPEAIISSINSSKAINNVTKGDCKSIFGSIYNFWSTGDRSLKYSDRKTKELFRHVVKACDRKLAKPIISREELREIASFGNTLDRAILYLLFESGMRMGEFVQLRKSDITQIAEGLEVHVPAGKTGERKVIVVEASTFVNRWLEEHPAKGEGPLWLSPEVKKPLCPAGIAKRIRVCVDRLNVHRKKQGIPPFNKPINPHNFRHSRASELGGESGMTEAILCKVFGWELDSDMPRTYLHLTDEMVKRAVLRTYGKAKAEEEIKIITHRTCARCKEENPIALNYCGRCGADLNTGKVISSVEELRSRVVALEGVLLKKRLSSKLKDAPSPVG